jgi:hypothetical protein
MTNAIEWHSRIHLSLLTEYEVYSRDAMLVLLHRGRCPATASRAGRPVVHVLGEYGVEFVESKQSHRLGVNRSHSRHRYAVPGGGRIVRQVDDKIDIVLAKREIDRFQLTAEALYGRTDRASAARCFILL